MFRQVSYCLFILMMLSLLGWMGSWSRLVKSGNQHYAAGRYDAALKAYQLATEQRPDSAIARYNLGTALYQRGRFDKAANAFRHSLVATDSTLRAQGYYNLGNAQFQLGDYRGAIRSYTSALRLHPTDGEAKSNLELAFERLKQQQARQQQQFGAEQRRGLDAGTQQRNTPNSERKAPNTAAKASIPQPVFEPMSKEDAIRLLETFSDDEKQLWEKLLQKRFASHHRPEKDW